MGCIVGMRRERIARECFGEIELGRQRGIASGKSLDVNVRNARVVPTG